MSGSAGGAHDGSPEATAKPPRSGTWLRIVSVVPLIPGLLWLMFAGPAWGFRVVVFLAIAISAAELAAMAVPTRRPLRLWMVASSLAVAACLEFAPARLHVVLLLLVAGALGSGLVRPAPVTEASLRTAWLLGGPLYVGATLVTVDLLEGLRHGGAWVLLSMVLAWLSDTFAYFSGRAFGRHKLYPKLSPKKTIEGALGGLAGSVLGAVLIRAFLLDAPPWVDVVLLAIVAGVLGQAGDLFESLIKRSTGVKDSGTLLPGHGGLLDRVDALMFTASATWIYAAYILPHR